MAGCVGWYEAMTSWDGWVGTSSCSCAANITDGAEALALGERVTAAISSPLTIGLASLTPTASVGVAWTAANRGIEAGALIAEADAAMYAAKHAGTVGRSSRAVGTERVHK